MSYRTKHSLIVLQIRSTFINCTTNP